MSAATSDLDDPVSTAFPEDLTSVGRWVGWRWGERIGKDGNPQPTKVPLSASTGRPADVTDADVWSTYPDAVAVTVGDGLGFVFTASDGLFGIDLDKCRDPQSGEIHREAQRIIDAIDTYTEISPSGTGVHLIGRGRLPPCGNRTTASWPGGQIEMYADRRYFCMTGQHVHDTPGNVEDRGAELAVLHAALFPPPAKPARRGSWQPRDGSDDELIKRARSARNGGRFARLWDGDWNAYPSQSEADLGLASHLVYWTGGDASRVDRLFRKSGLMRPKWERDDYRERTIKNALRTATGKIHTSQQVTNIGQREACAHIDGSTSTLATAILADHHFAQDAGGKLYRLQGGVYEPTGEALIKRRVKHLMAANRLSTKWTARRATEIVEYIRVDAPDLWERPPIETVNLANGLLDIESRTLRPHDPEFLSPVQLPVAFDLNATCPTWERSVSQVFPADALQLAWEIPAWLIRPDGSIQRAILLIGGGGNGKSRYLRGLRSFLGARNTSAVTLQKLEASRFAAASLVGKLANICADLPSEHLAGTSMFKAITGGDCIGAEYKFRDAFEFTPFVRLIFSANTPLQSKDGSPAFFDRWLVAPFPNEFRRTAQEISQDVLDAALAEPAELSGLLNKALDALPNLLSRHGFQEAASIRAALDEFRETTDPVAVWLDYSTISLPDLMVPKRDLLQAYNPDAYRFGRPRMTSTGFGLALRRLRPGLQAAYRKVHGERTHVWLRVGLRTGDV